MLRAVIHNVHEIAAEVIQRRGLGLLFGLRRFGLLRLGGLGLLLGCLGTLALFASLSRLGELLNLFFCLGELRLQVVRGCRLGYEALLHIAEIVLAGLEGFLGLLVFASSASEQEGAEAYGGKSLECAGHDFSFCVVPTDCGPSFPVRDCYSKRHAMVSTAR